MTPVQLIVGGTDPDGPCGVCGEPLTALGPAGQKSALVFVAGMEDPDQDDSWVMDPVHQWCAPLIEAGV